MNIVIFNRHVSRQKDSKKDGLSDDIQNMSILMVSGTDTTYLLTYQAHLDTPFC